MERFGLKEAFVVAASVLAPGIADSRDYDDCRWNHDCVVTTVVEQNKPEQQESLAPEIAIQIYKLRRQLGFYLTPTEKCEALTDEIICSIKDERKFIADTKTNDETGDVFYSVNNRLYEASVAGEVCLAHNGLTKAPFFYAETEKRLKEECAERGEAAESSIDMSKAVKVEQKCIDDYGLLTP